LALTRGEPLLLKGKILPRPTSVDGRARSHDKLNVVGYLSAIARLWDGA
jgi:hypothetical protein